MSKDLRLWEKGRGLIHHHLESLTSGEGGGGEIAESRYSSRALESIGGENWRGENGGGGPFERNLNASLFPPPFFLSTLLRS